MIYKIDNSISINETLKKCISGDEIHLKNGTYKEKIIININNIKITGEDKELTIIENMDYFHKIMPDYNVCNTFRTYTVYIPADNVTLSNLTIKNNSKPSSIYGQAVALYVDGNHFLAEDCIIDGAQDTLFCGPLPKDLIKRYDGFLLPSQLRGDLSFQQYKNCIIKGDVDFIFGCGSVIFDSCDIISIYHGENEIDGYLCAPSHGEEIEFGFIFNKCNIKCENKVKNVYLARPWRDYGYALFSDCNYGSHINPLGFSKWGPDRHLHARFYEYNENDYQRIDFSKKLDKKQKDEIINKFLLNV